MPNSRKVMLVILDGYGEGKDYFGNAITNAHNHYVEKLKSEYPTTLLKTDSEAVGLPANTMGGSEVGHFTIGAGRIVFQTLEEINRSIKNKSFFKKPEILEAINTAKESKLHLIGMISNAGVHSHINHLFALLEMAKKEGLKNEQIYIHAITDGRDVHEKCAKKYLKQIKEIGIGKIATICGRFYAMDRDKNWNRTQKYYDLLTQGKGHKDTNPLSAIDKAYNRGDETDYYIEPIFLNDKGLIKNEDAIINFNYRSDRSEQITTAFTNPEFKEFEAKIKPHYLCFGPYSKIAPIAFPPTKIKNNLGEVIANQGYSQLRMAETEKFPHVTFFFNSQNKTPNKNEKRIMVHSPKVASYADKPEMSAEELTNAFIKEIDQNNDYKFIALNFANTDLVGHSGDLEATKKAVDTVHKCLKKIIEKAEEKGYEIMVTADHGNAEYMVYEESGAPCPSHTMNKVIFILISKVFKNIKLRKDSTGLQDIAPTILEILEIEKPKEMTGRSLISKKN